MGRGSAVLVLVMVLASACGFPRDTGTTLADVRGGVLRVGLTENPPWVTVAAGEPPAGAEVELVKQLSARLNARIEWYPGAQPPATARMGRGRDSRRRSAGR
jgi:polar amino acid transport system substrate-binding protein